MLLNEIIKKLELGESGIKKYSNSFNPEIIGAASVEKAKANEISFIESGSYLLHKLDETEAGALILPNESERFNHIFKSNIAWIIANNPRIAFAEVLEFLNPIPKINSNIHKTAFIGENVVIGEQVSIGPNVCIEEGVKIGPQTIIHPGVVIYNNSIIGKNNQLHANCVIHPKTQIGDNCIINSNAVIGSEGFGFIPTDKGWRKMPQTGNVVLENNVEIGSCSTIDRPSVGETRIKKGTKIDNLIQVGHGVEIGEHCALAAQVGIAGGAIIGDGVILAGQVGVGNRVKVGANVIASSKCGIHADIKAGEVVSGFPAIPNKLWLRCSANFKKLPELAKAIKKINSSD